ncbi:MFS transporter [Rhizobium sp.]|uniref:MFS transporter n=1 Tax=Rhizobium sp. TaxID=391 RepID=UPI0028B1D734
MPHGNTVTSPPNKTAILAIILISYVMIVLDISVVLTGLPKIHTELGFSDAGLAWVQSAYTLTFGGFLLLGARAGDILGRRRMFIIGMTIFTVASVAIGASQSSAWMLSWRAVQGLGSAILAPTTLALLQTSFDEGEERVRAVLLYSAAAGVSATVGLVVGGLLADWLSWRIGFLINLPIGVAMVIAARIYIHETDKRPGTFDLPGAVTSTMGMGAFVYGFIRSAQAGWDTTTFATIAAAIIMLCAFVLIERRASQPILPLRLFSDMERSGAYAGRALYISAMVGFFFFTTLYLQQVAGLRPALAGLAFVPATMLHVPIAIIVPQLIRRFGHNTILITGMLIGISQGLTLSPLTSSGVARVAREDAGAASGAVNVAHQIGSSVGLGILIAIAAIGSSGLSGADLTAYRVSHAFDAGTVMLAATLLISLFTIVPAALRQALSQEEAAPAKCVA